MPFEKEMKPRRGGEDMAALEVEWNEALKALGDEHQFLAIITSQCDRPRLEKFLSDNYDLMTDKQRRFVTASLRMKLQREAEEPSQEETK